MLELQRLTTEYVDAEDRMRLTGEIRPGETLVLWLSQRLLLRLLPHLFLWLEKQGGTVFPADIVQSFEQAAAVETLGTEAPVQRSPDSKTWLVEAVDLTPDQQTLRLGFRREGEAPVSLTLPSTHLRQWLRILHLLWGVAEWPQEVWPEWMLEGQQRRSRQEPLLH